jgi:hypothetical protein
MIGFVAGVLFLCAAKVAFDRSGLGGSIAGKVADAGDRIEEKVASLSAKRG